MRRFTEGKISRLAAVLLLFGWMAVIYLFSAQPATESSRVSGRLAYRVAEWISPGRSEAEIGQLAQRLDHPIRKAAHMTEYAILGLLFVPVVGGRPGDGRRVYSLAFLLAVCYAATDEVHQIFVPGRSGQVSDVCVDAAGVLLGLLALFFLRKIRRRHCEKETHPVQ